MKILVLSRYPRKGASSRLRMLQFIPFLETNGCQLTVRPLLDESYLSDLYVADRRSWLRVGLLYLKRLMVLLGVFRYDVIWLEKELFPFFPAVFELLFRLSGKRYIVDYDDAVFHNYDNSSNLLVRSIFGQKIDAVMRNSWCVTAGNEYLASRARMAGATRVELVPTVVDASRYTVKQPRRASPLVIGWIGTPATQSSLAEIKGALLRVCKDHDARLLIVGATTQVRHLFPGLEVEVLPWTEESEGELVGRMDIGIMPLRNEPFQKGKCGYKLIQYMACSLPVVASPVGINVDIVAGSKGGMLAGTAEEWEKALDHLLESPELRSRMGSAGRKAVEETYSLEVQARRVAQIFQQATRQERA